VDGWGRSVVRTCQGSVPRLTNDYMNIASLSILLPRTPTKPTPPPCQASQEIETLNPSSRIRVQKTITIPLFTPNFGLLTNLLGRLFNGQSWPALSAYYSGAWAQAPCHGSWLPPTPRRRRWGAAAPVPCLIYPPPPPMLQAPSGHVDNSPPFGHIQPTPKSLRKYQKHLQSQAEGHKQTWWTYKTQDTPTAPQYGSVLDVENHVPPVVVV
jgi:hypothetical protein